ncbi:uncharacterized protein LOC110437627 [Sorghum bicolor]|uniref:uncharacterized protein LOC110437627 n=1 Tax=Sorghum bicolor TaxID=4558 RepID=UPI000B42684B|nr:uncharacterized protein LOC110437627 [Sorghum bicolor]|eukprot:XP_021321793.1 uncharacterized protein LOC110437627 [Sorghum bicolor]
MLLHTCNVIVACLDHLHRRRAPCAPPPFHEHVPHILLGIGGGAGTATSLARCGTGVAAGEEKHECVDGQDEVGGVAGSSLCERIRKDGFYGGVDHRAAASQDPRPPAASVLWLPFHLCASCRSSPQLPYTSSYRHLLLTRIVEPPPHQPFLRRPSSPPLRPWAVHTASLHQPRGALLYSYCSGLPIVVHLCPVVEKAVVCYQRECIL